MQLPASQIIEGEHAAPQAPQLAVFVRRSTHSPPQSTNPPLQTHAPDEHFISSGGHGW
jgi:hypothetical protein